MDEVNELLGAELPSGDWDSIGGLVLAVIGHVPAEGESVEVNGHLLVAERMQGRRIGSVRIQRLEGTPLHAGPRKPDEEWLAERAQRAADREERGGSRSERHGAERTERNDTDSRVEGESRR